MNAKSVIRLLAGWLLLSALNSQQSICFAQGTAFTYQGRLNNGTNVANGKYDMAFSLYTTNVSGAPIAGPVTNAAVAVTNGLFTTLVNFTNGFSGGSNWLQIAVSTNGANAFGTLLPRQQLTPVPYALMAAGVPGLIVQPNTDSPNLILGYSGNSVSGGVEGAVIGGGGGSNVDEGLTPNMATSEFTTIGGGYGNTVGGYGATIGGGYENSTGPGSTTGVEVVGGGYDNVASGDAAVIDGGLQNLASGVDTSIGGGINNIASAAGAVVAGGGYDAVWSSGNIASGVASVISGGDSNIVSGSYATVPGGATNVAAGSYSFAAGQNAQALNQGAFVWADSQNGAFASTNNNSFNVRAAGGGRFVTGGTGLNVDGPVTSSGFSGPGTSLTGVALLTTSNIFTGNQIVSSGSVGIGTTAPNELLEIGGGRAFIGDGGGASRKGVLIQGNTGNYGRIEAFNYASFTGLPLALNNLGHGNVGIGTTTPANALDVQGSADFTGNVGIGTTTPATTLEVNGSAKIDGTVTATTFSGNGSGLVGVPNLRQIALLKWAPSMTDNTFNVGFNPKAICFDGANIWVANYGPGTVTKLDAATGATIGTYTVGESPDAICFDGANIWVANYGSTNLTKLNAGTGATIGTYFTGLGVYALCYDGTNIWAGLSSLGRVLQFNASSGVAVNVFSEQNGGIGGSAAGLCFDGTSLWVADAASNNVAKLNPATGAIIGNYPVGRGPDAVCFDGANIWVASEFSGNVTKLNGSTGALIGTYPVGSAPVGICFDGTSIWVANAGGNSVTRLNAGTGATSGTYGTGSSTIPWAVCFDGASIWTTDSGGSIVTKF